MPTAAIAAYGTELRLSNGVVPQTLGITAADATTPIGITTLAHGYTTGDVIWMDIAGGIGDPGINGSWIADVMSPTTFLLRGSTSTGIYGGGAVATPRGTFTHVAELVNITPIGISFNMVDCSSHDGDGWGSSIPTFKRGVDMRVEVNLVPTHPTHDETTGMLFLALGKVRRDWLIVLPDVHKTTVAFQAWVSDHGTVTPFDGVLRATPVLSIDGQMAWTYGPIA